jgi:hypothetical protein
MAKSDKKLAELRMQYPAIEGRKLLSSSSLWVAAIERWIDGDESHLLKRIRSEEEIPKFAREGIALILEGEIPKKRGRPYEKIKPLSELAPVLALEADVREYCAAFEGKREVAILEAAARFGLTRDQVSKIVYPRGR